MLGLCALIRYQSRVGSGSEFPIGVRLELSDGASHGHTVPQSSIQRCDVASSEIGWCRARTGGGEEGGARSAPLAHVVGVKGDPSDYRA